MKINYATMSVDELEQLIADLYTKMNRDRDPVEVTKDGNRINRAKRELKRRILEAARA